MLQVVPRASLGYAYPVPPSLHAEWDRYPTPRGPNTRMRRLAMGHLGDASTLGQQVGQYGQIGGALTSAGLALAGATSLVPIVGPIIAGVSVILSQVIANSGCGQTCVISTDIVNKLEPELHKNVNGYLALPTPRPRAAQVAALANFDAAWQWLSSSTACGASQLGDAGHRCISDRASGSCVWKDNGNCWNWFVGYRDPIANDTQVADTAASDHALSMFGGDPLAALSGAAGSAGLDSKTTILLLGGALLLLGVMGK